MKECVDDVFICKSPMIVFIDIPVIRLLSLIFLYQNGSNKEAWESGLA